MASIPIDLLLSLHKVDDRLLVLFLNTINHTTKVSLLLSMPPALNYPLGLYDLCLDLILQLYYTSNRVTKALVRLILAFSVRLCVQKKFFRTVCHLEVFSI